MDLGGPIRPRSSLSWQLEIWLDGHVTWCLAFVVLAMLIPKAIMFPYPGHRVRWEFFLMSIHLPVQGLRNWCGSCGNKMERPKLVAAFLWLSAWSAFVSGYFFRLQTYVLRVEYFLSGATLVLIATGNLAAVFIGVSFCETPLDYCHVIVAFCFASAVMAAVVFIGG